MQGRFISFEGVDGCGKSTQVGLLVDRLTSVGCDVLRVREPGGTPLGEKIRALLLDPAMTMGARAELMLYEASRAELVSQVIWPALAGGTWVVADRFADSTCAYQSAGRGLALADVAAANALATGGLEPDLTFILDLDPREGLARAAESSGGALDRLELEGVAFQEAVRAAYLELARLNPGRMVVVDAAQSVNDVAAAITAALAERGFCGS